MAEQGFFLFMQPDLALPPLAAWFVYLQAASTASSGLLRTRTVSSGVVHVFFDPCFSMALLLLLRYLLSWFPTNDRNSITNSRNGKHLLARVYQSP